MISSDKTEPIIKEKSNISAVWLVPLIAVIFGAYLAIRAVMEMGVMISLNVPDMVGLIPGKTEVKYKGLVVGVVKKGITMSDNLDSVKLSIEMINQTGKHLNKETLFWLVKPEITLGGVAGLETLLSGNYIAMRPGKDTSLTQQLEFTLLNDRPSIAADTPGLHLTLTTKSLGSIGIGTQVFHHQIPVGKVTSYRFNKENRVEIGALIEPHFEHLVNENTRFWSASGIAIEGGISSFRIHIESVASLIAGGIAFDTPKYVEIAGPAKNFSRFSLFSDYKSAEVHVKATLIFPFDADIKENTKIVVKGIEAGVIKDFRLKRENREVITNVELDPRMQPLLNSNTVFFMVSPRISLAGISNLETAITGQYVSFIPSFSGKPQNTFHVALSPPALNYDYPGLHLTLTSPETGSLNYGDPVLYKDLVVGNIQQIEMLPGGQQFQIKIHIKAKYAHLVTKHSKFWNAGGLKLTGSARGFELQMGSMQTLLSGGIAFGTNDSKPASATKIENGDAFALYPDEDSTIYTRQFTVEFKYRDDISAGATEIKLANKVIGKVIRVDTDFRRNKLIATLTIKQEMSWLLNSDSRFWLVTPTLSNANISQLISGTYINVGAGFGHQMQDQFVSEKRDHAEAPSAPGLQLQLIARGKTSIAAGSRVFYRNIPIGYVSAVKLAHAGDTSEIAVTINEQYQGQVASSSRFYEASGLDIKMNTRGVTIRTASLSAIISGGIALYQPGELGDKVDENTRFTLYETYDDAIHAGLAITIHFPSGDALFEGMSIKYQQQEIGTIERIRFNSLLQGVTVDAQLYEVAQHLATTGARIWKVIPSLGLVGNKNLDALLSPYLAIAGGDGKAATKFTALAHQPPVKSLATGFNLRLTARKLGSVRVGNPILFRQVKVGQVIGTDLNPDNQQIAIYVNIQPKYRQLVTDHSVFWNASGIRVKAGLFSGVNIDTESVEALVAGGIAFANPPETPMSDAMSSQLVFALHDKAQNNWPDW